MTVVNSLLAQLCSDLGFCMAARTPEDFVALAEDVNAFADKVFALEGMDPTIHSALRKKVMALVAVRLGSEGTSK